MSVSVLEIVNPYLQYAEFFLFFFLIALACVGVAQTVIAVLIFTEYLDATLFVAFSRSRILCK